MPIPNNFHEIRGGLALTLGVALACALAAPQALHAQGLDLCGCADLENTFSVGDFNTKGNYVGVAVRDLAPRPDRFTIALPPDGVMVFDSFTVEFDRVFGGRGSNEDEEVVFTSTNNAPVTLLVKGDVTIHGNQLLSVDGSDGAAGTTGSFGAAGRGGPGGFAGGDGAYQVVNDRPDGGDGIGPGGGAGSNTSLDDAAATAAEGGIYVGLKELLPLLGGSGGGGGRSDSGAPGCSGGGGGGGGGGILIVANGTVTVNGVIRALGGGGGNMANLSCSSGGGGGSGGAIRIVANTIIGTGIISAAGGAQSVNSPVGLAGGAGKIRLEAIENTFRVDGTNPVASRDGPGPIVNISSPTVTITGIEGAETPLFPIGFLGGIDMIVEAPGEVSISVDTTSVPAGTTVDVTIKPKVQSALIRTTTTTVTLLESACLNANADACAVAVVDLEPGIYIVEAQATFQTE